MAVRDPHHNHRQVSLAGSRAPAAARPDTIVPKVLWGELRCFSSPTSAPRHNVGLRQCPGLLFSRVSSCAALGLASDPTHRSLSPRERLVATVERTLFSTLEDLYSLVFVYLCLMRRASRVFFLKSFRRTDATHTAALRVLRAGFVSGAPDMLETAETELRATSLCAGSYLLSRL